MRQNQKMFCIHCLTRFLVSEAIVFWDRFTMYNTDQFLQLVAYYDRMIYFCTNSHDINSTPSDSHYAKLAYWTCQERSFSLQTNRC